MKFLTAKLFSVGWNYDFILKSTSTGLYLLRIMTNHHVLTLVLSDLLHTCVGLYAYRGDLQLLHPSYNYSNNRCGQGFTSFGCILWIISGVEYQFLYYEIIIKCGTMTQGSYGGFICSKDNLDSFMNCVAQKKKKLSQYINAF